ncbi:MAG: carboxypeptidase regulatory-like domain-containing protein [Myxococcales bacterium]|nr:carboxypeptidase regulatory-like domain-containing protein [Myxococcales bacterium]
MRPAHLLLACALLAAPSAAQAGGVRRPATQAPTNLAPKREVPLASAQVVGRVVDHQGQAIPGVTVVATHADRRGPAPRRVKSDRDGQFRFALPPGEYVFVALDRELSGATPAMAVARALDVVLVVTRAMTSA